MMDKVLFSFMDMELKKCKDSQNHGVFEAGRDLRGRCGPTTLLRTDSYSRLPCSVSSYSR